MVVFVDEWNIVPKCIAILKCVKNLRLVGETGTGKTTLVHYLAEKLNVPLFEHVLSIDTNRWELIASDVLQKGETKVREGIVLMWLKAEKGILYLDGYNYAPPNVTSLIECLSDWRGSIWIPELQQTFKRGEEHYLIISMNPYEKAGYTGTHQMNIASMRRFETVWCYYLSIRKETEYLMKFYKNYRWVRKLVEFANKTRTLYREGKLTMPLTTGNLINYCLLKKEGLDDRDIIEIASGHYLDEERPVVKRLWEEEERN